MLMRWPQRVQTSVSTWYTLAISLAQLGGHRRLGGGVVRAGSGGVRLELLTASSRAARVLAVEDRTVLSRIRDVVANAGEPFERVQGFVVYRSWDREGPIAARTGTRPTASDRGRRRASGVGSPRPRRRPASPRRR